MAIHVNHRLLKDGWCWWDRKYTPGDTELEKLEKEAREAKKGLWADSAPIPPWVYRKAKRGQSLDLSDLVPFETDAESSAASRGFSRMTRRVVEELCGYSTWNQTFSVGSLARYEDRLSGAGQYVRQTEQAHLLSRFCKSF